MTHLQRIISDSLVCRGGVSGIKDIVDDVKDRVHSQNPTRSVKMGLSSRSAKWMFQKVEGSNNLWQLTKEYIEAVSATNASFASYMQFDSQNPQYNPQEEEYIDLHQMQLITGGDYIFPNYSFENGRLVRRSRRLARKKKCNGNNGPDGDNMFSTHERIKVI